MKILVIGIITLFLLTILSCSPAYKPQELLITTTTVTITTFTHELTTTTSSPSQPGPEYKVVSFTIKGSEDEYIFPIYLKNDQTLHLTWFIKEGDAVWFHILTPSGKNLGFYTNGQFADGTLEDGFCQGFTDGKTIFGPSGYGWGEGYYEMLITSNSASPSTVEINYWIEDNTPNK